MNSFTTTVLWILATYYFSVALCGEPEVIIGEGEGEIDGGLPGPGEEIGEVLPPPRLTLRPFKPIIVTPNSEDVLLTVTADPPPGQDTTISYSILDVNDAEIMQSVVLMSGYEEATITIAIPATETEILVSLENNPGSAYVVGGKNQSAIIVSNDIDGGWSEWQDPPLMYCSLCTDKLQSIRTCTNPAPAGDGKPCEGESTRTIYCYDSQLESGCNFQVNVKMILAPGLPENVARDAVKNRMLNPENGIVLLHQKATVQQTTHSFSLLISPRDDDCGSYCIYSGLTDFDYNPIIPGIGEVVYIDIFPEDTTPPICFNEEQLLWRFYDPSPVGWFSSGAPENECSEGVLSAFDRSNRGARPRPLIFGGLASTNAHRVLPKPIPSFNLSMYLQTYETEDGEVLISEAFVSMVSARVLLRNNELYVEQAFTEEFFPFTKDFAQRKAQVQGMPVLDIGRGEPLEIFSPAAADEWIYFEVTVAEGGLRIKVGEREFTPLLDIGGLTIIGEGGPQEEIEFDGPTEFDGPFLPSNPSFDLIAFGATGNVSAVILTTICQIDGWLAPGEECDDGNFVDDDGCSNSCKLVQEELCTCAEGDFTVIHLDRPSWMNEEPPSLAEDATKIFNVDCPSNAECCFTIQRPYVKGGVWSIGGSSLEADRDDIPWDLPRESTDFQNDFYNGWQSNNVNGPQGPCFERIKANAPGSRWITRTEGCDLIQTYCFDPIAERLPFECKNSTSISDSTGLPIFTVTCDIYLDLLRPKHTNIANSMYGWPTSSFLKWGNRLHTDIVIDMGVEVTSTLDYVTPYINTQVDEMGYLIGNVELDFGATQWRAFRIEESKLGSWESDINGDGTNSTGEVQKDENGKELGYELSLPNNRNVAIKSNSIRAMYRDTIYLRIQLQDNNAQTTTVTLKVEIKARNIIVDKSQNPIGLNIQPVVKILQRDPTTPRDLNTAVIPSYPVLSIEDLFVMDIPRTDNSNLRLSSITATLHRTQPNGELIRPAVAVLIDENTPIANPLWEFQIADASYIQSNGLSTAYSFRLAVEAGSYAIEQTLLFEVFYAESQKMSIQQVTKPASLQTTTQLTVSVGFNGEEILQIETDVNTIDSNNNNEDGLPSTSTTTSGTVVIDTQKPQTVNAGATTESQSSPLVTGIIAGSIGAVVVVVIIALVILVILKFKQQDNEIENRPLTPRTKQQQMDMNL